MSCYTTTNRSASGQASKAHTTLKIAVLAPIPASVSTTTAAKPGARAIHVIA